MPLGIDVSVGAGTLFWGLIFFVPFALAGFAIGRWWVLLALAAWCVVIVTFLVLNAGLYGQGWGEGDVTLWIAGPTVLVLAGGALGLWLRRGWDRRSS